jgi:uncharacterized protein (DUF1330 family)
MPKGYLIAHVKVNDFEAFTPYKERAWELVDKYKGKWIVRAPKGGDLRENANGVAENSATVVVEFDSYEHAKAYYESEEYQTVKELRLPNSESTFVLVEGADEKKRWVFLVAEARIFRPSAYERTETSSYSTR